MKQRISKNTQRGGANHPSPLRVTLSESDIGITGRLNLTDITNMGFDDVTDSTLRIDAEFDRDMDINRF